MSEHERERRYAAEIESALLIATPSLQQLDWAQSLTRDGIQERITGFPHILYLRLPASKRFSSATEVTQAIRLSEAVAEDAFGDDEAVAAERDVRSYGGPPAWGSDPLVAGLTQDSGSDTDTKGLDAGLDGNSALENEG